MLLFNLSTSNIQLFQKIGWKRFQFIRSMIIFVCVLSLLFLLFFFSNHPLWSRLSFADVKRTIQHNSTASFARARAYQLPRCITRALWISSRTFAAMFDYRIKSKQIERQFIKYCNSALFKRIFSFVECIMSSSWWQLFKKKWCKHFLSCIFISVVWNDQFNHGMKYTY